MTILRKYGAFSGQSINLAKSSVTFAALTPMAIRQNAKQILKIHKKEVRASISAYRRTLAVKKRTSLPLLLTVLGKDHIATILAFYHRPKN